MTESECLSEFRFGKKRHSNVIAVFHIKVISSIVKICDLPYLNLSLTSSLARPPQLLSFFEVKTIHWSNFQLTSFVRRTKERYLDLRG